MAEKRKMSTAGSGAKRIKALFSSFIRKGQSDQTEGISPTETQGSQPAITDASDPMPGDGTDGVAPGSESTEIPARRSFRPTDSEDFFGRVETYTAFGWFAKPWDLSPLHCARYGWENIEADCLKCVSCKEILCGELPVLWERESYSQAYEKLKDSVKAAHSKMCPWPVSPSPESFLHIPLSNIKSSVEGFHSRVDSLYPLGVGLPSIDYSPIEEEERFKVDDLKSVLLKAVTERGDSPVIVNEEDNPIWLAACILAVFGWQRRSVCPDRLWENARLVDGVECQISNEINRHFKSKHHQSQSEQTSCPVLVCQYCRRHAGLWNFTSLKEADAKQAAVTDTEEESLANGNEDVVKSAFNPSAEHRAWCPWVQPSPDRPAELQRPSSESPDANGDVKLPAELSWQQLTVILLKQTDPDSYGALVPVINKATTPPSQTWKAVRRILNIWQSKQSADPPQKTPDPVTSGDAS